MIKKSGSDGVKFNILWCQLVENIDALDLSPPSTAKVPYANSLYSDKTPRHPDNIFTFF